MTRKISVPPDQLTEAGEKRRVGVEIEFSGLSVAETSGLVQGQFGGSLVKQSAHRHMVEETPFGAFTIELDAQIVHDPDSDGAEDADNAGLGRGLREAIGTAATGLVPIEIVAPPIPWDELDCLDGLFDHLREAGAQGTEDHVLNSFGLHLNPEVAQQNTDYILRHLRAFLVLSEWLREAIGVDMTRRLMPHIEPFPKAYALKVIELDDAPDLASFIDDYIAANPTRNRDLDLLPLLCFLDEDRITSQMDSALIKARPTFHYRLPNSSISVQDWNAVVEWNRWVKVEKLAADRDRLAKACVAHREKLDKSGRPRGWDELVDWLTQ